MEIVLKRNEVFNRRDRSPYRHRKPQILPSSLLSWLQRQRGQLKGKENKLQFVLKQQIVSPYLHQRLGQQHLQRGRRQLLIQCLRSSSWRRLPRGPWRRGLASMAQHQRWLPSRGWRSSLPERRFTWEHSQMQKSMTTYSDGDFIVDQDEGSVDAS